MFFFLILRSPFLGKGSMQPFFYFSAEFFHRLLAQSEKYVVKYSGRPNIRKYSDEAWSILVLIFINTASRGSSVNCPSF